MKNKNQEGSSFLKGAFILVIAGLVTRIIGAFFRIPLGNILGLEAMGYYSAAYPVYVFFVVLATSGLPTGIARMIAEHRVVSDYEGIHKAFKAGAVLMISIGLFGFLVLFFGAGFIVNFINNPGAEISVKVLAPAVLVVSVLALFRGYFQGFQNMVPFAWSLIIEQIGRVLFGYALAVILLNVGPEYAAGGATSGALVGGIFSLLIILISYQNFNDKHREQIGYKLDHSHKNGENQKTSKAIKKSIIIKTKKLKNDVVSIAFTTHVKRPESKSVRYKKGRYGVEHSQGLKQYIIKLLKISIPITVGAAVLPLINLVDVGLVISRLMSIGFTPKRSNELFSMLTGYAATMVNLPQAVTAGLQIAIVPAVASYFTTKNYGHLDKTISAGLRITIMLVLPAAAGLSLLSHEILSLLYPAHMESIETMGNILSVLGFSVIFLGLFQVTTGIMQGMGKQNLPAINLIIAVCIKIALNYFLVATPSLNIYGAAISTLISYFIALLLNVYSLSKIAETKIKFWELSHKSLFSTVVMSASVILVVWIWPVSVMSRLRTVVAILVGVVVYGYLILALRSFNDEDYELLPGGAKIKRLERRLFRR